MSTVNEICALWKKPDEVPTRATSALIAIQSDESPLLLDGIYCYIPDDGRGWRKEDTEEPLVAHDFRWLKETVIAPESLFDPGPVLAVCRSCPLHCTCEQHAQARYRTLRANGIVDMSL